jgi:hypothetical protein
VSKKYRCQLIEIAPSGQYYPVGGEIVFGEYRPTIRTPKPVNFSFRPPENGYVPDPPKYFEWECFGEDVFGRLLYKKKEQE